MLRTYPFKTVPYAHQLTALEKGWESKEYALFMEMGCVDRDTEYLSPTGWVKISEYTGGTVAQYNLDGTAEFVEPEAFVKKPCETMYLYKSERGLDQMLSPDHRMLVLRRSKSRKSHNDDTFKVVHAYSPDQVQAETTPSLLDKNPTARFYGKVEYQGCHGTGIDLTDEEIRVQVAFHADGSYGTRDLSGVTPERKGGLRLKHQSKIKRIQKLLEKARISFEVKDRGIGFFSTRFIPPRVSKIYGAEWWNVSKNQKEVILDEVFRWDGNQKKHLDRKNRGLSYSSIHKSDADFIQFCANSTGRRASVTEELDGTWKVRLVGTGRSTNQICISHKRHKKVPSPDGFMYCFRVPSSYLVLRRNGNTFITGNTGKSKVTVDNIALLFDTGKINAAFIIAPKGVYQNWYDKEIPQHLPSHIPYRMALWKSGLPAKTKQEINHLFEPSDDLRIFIVNVDALITKTGAALFLKFVRSHDTMIICDESTILKTPSAQRTKAALVLSKEAVYRRILTGSPVTKSPLDIYSQCAFLNDGLLGYSSYWGFKHRYAVVEPTVIGGRTIQLVKGYQHVEELQAILQPFSYRVLKEDCLDLPEKIFMKRTFEMSDEQKRVYEQMRLTAIAFMEGGEATTTHAITQILRLHQISCGFLPLDDGAGIKELKNSRMAELLSTLDEVEGKVIIWANYRHDIHLISKRIAEEYGAESLVTYFGDTSDDDRKNAVKNFQDKDHPVRFFLGNTQTGGYGITLTEARTVIYYSNNYDLEKRLQSEDRAHRIGQHHPVVYIDLMCRDTVDEKIITALRNKISIARAVTGDSWKDWI